MQTSIPEYFQPQHSRENAAYHVIELDGITFVEYQLFEKPPLCKAHLAENMFLIVLDGSKEIDAGATALFQVDPARQLRHGRGLIDGDGPLSVHGVLF